MARLILTSARIRGAVKFSDGTQKAAIQGRLPRGFSVKRLTDLPMLWSEQWRAIGMQEPIEAQAEAG